MIARSTDSLALNLPLPAGHVVSVEGATLNVIGAAGTWDAANRWQVEVQARGGNLSPQTTLASATFGQAGAANAALPVGQSTRGG